MFLLLRGKHRNFSEEKFLESYRQWNLKRFCRKIRLKYRRKRRVRKQNRKRDCMVFSGARLKKLLVNVTGWYSWLRSYSRQISRDTYKQLLLDPIRNTMRTYRPSRTKKTVRNALIATMSIERRGKTVFKVTREKKKKRKKRFVWKRSTERRRVRRWW